MFKPELFYLFAAILRRIFDRRNAEFGYISRSPRQLRRSGGACRNVAVSLSVRRPRRSLTMSVLRTSNHHRLGTRAASVRTRAPRSDRVVFVIEDPTRSDGGIEHEGHQCLCPLCLAETARRR